MCITASFFYPFMFTFYFSHCVFFKAPRILSEMKDNMNKLKYILKESLSEWKSY